MGAASFSVTARLVMNPNFGAVGSAASAQGFGFDPGEAVKVYWNSPRTLLGTATANINGTFAGSAALSFTVPAGGRPGGMGCSG